MKDFRSTYIIIRRTQIVPNDAEQSIVNLASLKPLTVMIIVKFHTVIADESLENSIGAIHIAAAVNIAS